jgi:SAM-dependent methyltransferase
MNGTRDNEKLFWNNRAKDYPLPFEPETLARTERILRLLKRMGVDFANRRILDIGCGTGVYGLPLARGAKSVLCLDSSPAMLKVFRVERRRRNIANASSLLASWTTLPSSRLAGRFDIALASMTLAIKSRVDLLKMEKAARERCVYIGWAGIRRNTLMGKIYRKHGLKYKAPIGSEAVIPALSALGRKFTVSFVRESWEKTTLPSEALREIEVTMRVNGVELQREWVERLLNESARNGVVTRTTQARKALITWRVP